MVKFLLKHIGGFPDVDSVSYFEWGLRHTWHPSFLVLLIMIGAGLTIWSYRALREKAPAIRVIMGLFRVIALLIMLIILFEPVLSVDFTRRGGHEIAVVIDASESMTIKDVRENPGELEEAALAMGLNSLDVADLPADAMQGLKSATRLDLARSIIANNQNGLVEQLGEDYSFRFYEFSEKLNALSPIDSIDGFGDIIADGQATDLGSALDDITQQRSAKRLAGVAVLSDFAWNQGHDPAESARRMKERGIPIYPIAVGAAEPADVSLTRIYAEETAFAGEMFLVSVQLKSSRRFARRAGSLELEMGDVKKSRMVTFNGDYQIEEFSFVVPDTPGDHDLTIRIKAMDEEAVTDNNELTRAIFITDEKIKVLYVEGMPRWEYRFLRWVLMRDPRLDVKFILTEGDQDLADSSPMYLEQFPEAGVAGLDFDLVIIGDVEAAYFTARQSKWIVDLVKRRGGALLMIAGTSYAPTSYVRTPLADLLPVYIEKEPWKKVSKLESPVVTSDGFTSRIVTLSDDLDETKELWRLLRPLESIPVVTPKPGATVLLRLSHIRTGELGFPLIAWQRVGAGKSLFVGTEKVWRIRYKTGRLHHERFWSQTIQFLALSRLRGGNIRITLETDKSRYAAGERVHIFAHVLDRVLEPLKADSYTVTVAREDDRSENRSVTLEPDPAVPGFFRGYLITRDEGQYVVRPPAEDLELANEPTFRIKSESLELQYPGMQLETARRLAEISQGTAVTRLADLPTMLGHLKAQTEGLTEHADLEIWDHPIIYILLLFAAGMEWLIRRQQRLV